LHGFDDGCALVLRRCKRDRSVAPGEDDREGESNCDQSNCGDKGDKADQDQEAEGVGERDDFDTEFDCENRVVVGARIW